MSFYSELLDRMRGINETNRPMVNLMFGTIVSGNYSQWKTDPHPTIFCFGQFNKNGRWKIHGIQLHNNPYVSWLMYVINSMKKSGMITSPLGFYNYLKLNQPYIVRQFYRTYSMEFADFKTIAPGLANIPQDYCYPIEDQRDSYLIPKPMPQINPEELQNNINRALNVVKL